MSKARIEIPSELQAYIEIEHCDDFPINRYYVTTENEQLFNDIIRMKQIAAEMNDMNLDYMNTTLLYGPPGTGKTMLGKYIAYRLDLDFAYINYAKLIDGIFGNTARNISGVFRFMADTECVFMMDELDCIAIKRGKEGAATGGELSRITITLMQELDYYRKHKVKSIILGATNKLENIDDALLSRFSLQKELKNLNNAEKEEYIKLFLQDVGIPYDPGNIKNYCSRNSALSQRSIEADMIRCIAAWIDDKKRNFELNHVQKNW